MLTSRFLFTILFAALRSPLHTRTDTTRLHVNRVVDARRRSELEKDAEDDCWRWMEGLTQEVEAGVEGGRREYETETIEGGISGGSARPQDHLRAGQGTSPVLSSSVKRATDLTLLSDPINRRYLI